MDGSRQDVVKDRTTVMGIFRRCTSEPDASVDPNHSRCGGHEHGEECGHSESEEVDGAISVAQLKWNCFIILLIWASITHADFHAFCM